jgi:hypothetical protein
MAPPAPVAAGVGFGAGFGAGFAVGLLDLAGCDLAGGFFFDGDGDWAEHGEVAEVRATAAARRKRRAVGAGIILWGRRVWERVPSWWWWCNGETAGVKRE